VWITFHTGEKYLSANQVDFVVGVYLSHNFIRKITFSSPKNMLYPGMMSTILDNIMYLVNLIWFFLTLSSVQHCQWIIPLSAYFVILRNLDELKLKFWSCHIFSKKKSL